MCFAVSSEVKRRGLKAGDLSRLLVISIILKFSRVDGDD